MREVSWQRVDEASSQPNPDGWIPLPLQKDVGFAELHAAVLDASKLASAELYIQQPGPSHANQHLHPWDFVPTGQLFVKVVAYTGVYFVFSIRCKRVIILFSLNA